MIDPKTDRNTLWDAITAKIQTGEFDRQIEAVSQAMLANFRHAKDRKRSRNAA